MALIYYLTHVHLGFGVATSRGLLVPVVRDAQTRTTRELAAVVTGLVDAARAGRIAPADLTGVRSLAGYVRGQSGQMIAVAIVVNSEQAGAAVPALDKFIEWVRQHG